MSNIINRNIVIQEFKSLVGNRILHSRAGGAAGSVLSIHFSENKIHASAKILIWCHWRLSRNNLPIVSSTESYQVGGPLCTIPQFLEGLEIKKIIFNNVLDYSMRFTNNYQLDVFSDQTPNSVYSYENWTLAVIEKNIYYELSKEYLLTFGKYDSTK